MRIVVIGCSHGRHLNLDIPPGDALIHTGDYSRRGDRSDAIDFLKWFEKQPHPIRAFLGGNHDGHSEEHPEDFAALIEQYAPSCYYLHDRTLELGGLKWHGSNYTPAFFDWWWNAERGPVIAAEWDKIPTDTQILITHGPAHGHLDLVPAEYVQNGRDRHQGCHDLRRTIDERLKSLKLHAFSHLHSQGCQTEVVSGVAYVNGAVVGEDYKVRGQIQVIDL